MGKVSRLRLMGLPPFVADVCGRGDLRPTVHFEHGRDQHTARQSVGQDIEPVGQRTHTHVNPSARESVGQGTTPTDRSATQ
jgi:hypothetical protein